MRYPAFALTALLVAAPVPAQDIIAELKSAEQRLQATVALYAKNIDTGKIIAYREDELVRTASTIKLPIMAALFDKVRRGEARWDETLELRAESKVSGSGVLREFSDGLRIPLKDLTHLMIVVSDNTATNLLLDKTTPDEVNAFLDGIGLKRTRSLRKIRGDGTQLKAATGWSKAGMLDENKRFGVGVSTSREMAMLMEMIAQGKCVSPEAGREMIAILKRQQYKDGIGRRLKGIEVASKSGALDALRSDVALIETPRGRVVMAITVDGLKTVDYSEDNAGLLAIADLARMVAGSLSH